MKNLKLETLRKPVKNIARIAFLLLLSTIFVVNSTFGQDTIKKVRKNDIKFTILSIGSGSTRLTYERAFGKNMSAEFTVGLIGLGYDFLHKLESRGLGFKLAYKWNLIPMKSANSPLAGFYVKPEIQFAHFKYAPMETGLASKDAKTTTHTAILAECGYQVLLKWFVFDVYVGLGPAFGTGNDENYFHGFMLMPKESWLATTAGFRVGVAF